MTSKPVPREEIPWYPSVRSETCSGCRVCFEFCQYGVYVWDEDSDIPRVHKPFNCMVGCNGCEGLCPEGAISFPELDTIAEIIKKLREAQR